MNTVVAPCPCTNVQDFNVKSAGTKTELRPRATVPWNTRDAGARFQDARYGKGQRLHNIGGRGTSKTITCTVCGQRKLN